MSAYFGYPEHYSSPRDRYYEALAQAEAAKAGYEASVAREVELARRQRARDAYILQQEQRRRAAFEQYDDQLYGYPTFDYQPRRVSFNPYHQAVRPYHPQRNHYVERQRELEHARFIAEERARIRAEVEAAAEAKAKREAEARAAQWKARREHAIQAQQRVAQQQQQQETVTLDDVLAQIFSQATEAQRPVRNTTSEGTRKHCQRRRECGSQSCQPSRVPADACCAKPKEIAAPAPKAPEQTSTSEQAGLEQFLSHIFGVPVKVTESAPETPASSSKPAVAAPPAKPKAPTPVASTSTAPAPAQPSFAPLKDLLAARLGSEPEADVREALQGLFGSIFPQQQARRSPSAKSEGSMKEQLEARLRRDQDAEARDIELAIAESLKDAPSSPSSSKGKSVATPQAPVVNTPATSLATINEIEALFKTLAAAFEFPNKLDISPPSSPGAHSTSTLSRLAFTAANAPVRYYEQALSGLLSRLDAIESSGDEEVRHRRKEVVNAVETALEEVEREVETRAAMVTARDSTRATSVPIIAEPVAPKQVEVQEQQVDESAPAVEEPVVVDTEDLVDLTVPESTATEPVVEDSPEASTEESAAVETATEESAAPAYEESTASAPSYPPSITDSNATVTAEPTVEEQEPFLLTKLEPEVVKVPANTDVDDEPVVIGDGAGSDWSEVEA